ncbi:uncharacterized protein [Argopecten irradians]|uniref:uncharacterized protein n=1 Tax=Argopecten irradians TaxID=31199 RepID=UPI00371DA7E0
MFEYGVTVILALVILLPFIHIGATSNGPINTRLLQEDDLLLADPISHVSVYEGSAFEDVIIASEEMESEVGVENYFGTGSAPNTTFTDLGGYDNNTGNSIRYGKSEEKKTPTSIIAIIVIVSTAFVCGVVVSSKLLYERYVKRNVRKDPTDYDSDEYSVMMTWD